MSTIEKKVSNIFKIMGYLAEGRALYAQDEKLHDDLGLDGSREANTKKIERYLKDIDSLYEHIIKVEKQKQPGFERSVTTYSVIDREKDVSEILRFFIEHSEEDLGWLLQAVHENNKEVLNDTADKKRLEKILTEDRDIFLFVGAPFEKFDKERNQIFNKAKNAVKNREYRDIVKFDGSKLCNAKMLKLVYTNQNWYIAVETEEEKIELLRISFIKEINYSEKNGYQKKSIAKYDDYFKNLQNPFTLNKPSQEARLLVTKSKAHYFKSDMKPFFPSQEIIREHDDGSIEFSVSFTQPMEILPFIKQWSPYIKILSPQHLIDSLIKDLNETIKSYRP